MRSVLKAGAGPGTRCVNSRPGSLLACAQRQAPHCAAEGPGSLLHWPWPHVEREGLSGYTSLGTIEGLQLTEEIFLESAGRDEEELGCRQYELSLGRGENARSHLEYSHPVAVVESVAEPVSQRTFVVQHEALTPSLVA